MSAAKSAILLGAALALIPGQGAFAHGTEPHVAAVAGDTSAHSQGAGANIDLTIDPAAPTAQVVRVTRGAHVHLTVRGAGANEMHLHGYDIEVQGVMGQPALFVFEATHTGRFALEMHVEDDILGKREKAALYIEVREQ
jgi:hypothetical protein